MMPAKAHTVLKIAATAVVALTAAACTGRGEAHTAQQEAAEVQQQARFRVIIDNDFGGDPDGLFHLAHQMLSPSTEVRGVIGSLNYENFYGMDGSSAESARKADELLALMGLQNRMKATPGRAVKLESANSVPEADEATDLIIREAMSDDPRPLYVLCGAGLTDIAAAYLREPQIAEHLTLVWIGGPEYADLSEVAPRPQQEYNLMMDLTAAQVVFNQSQIPVWQIPRDVYRQCICSVAELDARVSGTGAAGEHLGSEMKAMMERAGGYKMGEAYVLGDSPLALVTALMTAWEPDPASCSYASVACPLIGDDGWYKANPSGRTIRVFTQLDLRLMFEDFFAKISRL